MQDVLWVGNLCYLVNVPRNGDTVSLIGTTELMKIFPCGECVFGAQLLKLMAIGGVRPVFSDIFYKIGLNTSLFHLGRL